MRVNPIGKLLGAIVRADRCARKLQEIVVQRLAIGWRHLPVGYPVDVVGPDADIAGQERLPCAVIDLAHGLRIGREPAFPKSGRCGLDASYATHRDQAQDRDEHSLDGDWPHVGSRNLVKRRAYATPARFALQPRSRDLDRLTATSFRLQSLAIVVDHLRFDVRAREMATLLRCSCV